MAVDYVSPVGHQDVDRFEHFWNQRGEWVEEPNERRGGQSGVQRIVSAHGRLLYAKRQIGHLYRSWLYPFGRPTVMRERDALNGLRMLDVGVPELVFCGAQQDQHHQWQGLLVTAALEGYVDIEQWYAAGERERHGEEVHERLLKQLAGNLARMHNGRWQHGCLYAKHIFVRVVDEQVDVALLDLEKARQRLNRTRAARHDMQQLRRHSSWSGADWQKLSYFYEAAFGSAIKGLT